jgi:hypothetical protein
MDMKKRLPIGIQDFVSIREDDFLYVDKTSLIHRLISGSGRFFFLSRPRRFGKSLLCSTLGAIFEGRRELFNGLAVDSLEWEWKKHPVIKLDLNPGNYKLGSAELYVTLNRELEFAALKYEVPFSGETISDRFSRLIYALKERFQEKTVVVIDEYDKPLLNTMDDPAIHIAMRDELKAFYGVLKSSDAYLKFVSLTGVTKFSHVSIFSDLNQLVDLTLDPRYATLCGLTQEEVDNNFESEIKDILSNTGKDKETYVEELRKFYNGYRFSKSLIKVYNPFGLLKHFDSGGEFLPYWYETGTPTFLIKLMDKQKIDVLELNDLRVAYEDFGKYDMESMRAVPVLYQSGYLTITDYDEESKLFVLNYPNEEIRSSFTKSLLEHYAPVSESLSRSLHTQLPQAFFKGDVASAMNALKIFFL